MQMTDLLARLLSAFTQAMNGINNALTDVESLVRVELASLGITPAVQTPVLFGIVLFITFMIARVFHGVIRFAVILVMLAVAVRVVSGNG